MKKFFHLYWDGFRNLTDWGKKLWIIILLKGILIFVVMKLVFFPNQLKQNFDTDQDRATHVLNNLTKKQ